MYFAIIQKYSNSVFRASNYAQPINGYKNANINKNAKKWKKFFVY